LKQFLEKDLKTKRRLSKKTPEEHLYVPNVATIRKKLEAFVEYATEHRASYVKVKFGLVECILQYFNKALADSVIFNHFYDPPKNFDFSSSRSAPGTLIFPHAQPVIKVVHIGVSEKARGRGVATLFLLSAAKAAEKMGCRLMLEQTTQGVATTYLGKKLVQHFGWLPSHDPGPHITEDDFQEPHVIYRWHRSYLSPEAPRDLRNV